MAKNETAEMQNKAAQTLGDALLGFALAFMSGAPTATALDAKDLIAKNEELRKTNQFLNDENERLAGELKERHSEAEPSNEALREEVEKLKAEPKPETEKAPTKKKAAAKTKAKEYELGEVKAACVQAFGLGKKAEMAELFESLDMEKFSDVTPEQYEDLYNGAMNIMGAVEEASKAKAPASKKATTAKIPEFSTAAVSGLITQGVQLELRAEIKTIFGEIGVANGKEITEENFPDFYVPLKKLVLAADKKRKARIAKHDAKESSETPEHDLEDIRKIVLQKTKIDGKRNEVVALFKEEGVKNAATIPSDRYDEMFTKISNL